MEDKIKSIKEKAISLVEQGINQDVSCIDAKELYYIVDVMKDAFEICKLYNESEYFKNINKAMEESTDEDNTRKMMEKYLSELSYKRTYIPHMRYYGKYSKPTTATLSKNEYVMYPEDDDYHDDWDGDAWKYRRSYMENKSEKGKDFDSTGDIEKYVKSLSDDIMSMIKESTPQEKLILKQKMNALISKMG